MFCMKLALLSKKQQIGYHRLYLFFNSWLGNHQKQKAPKKIKKIKKPDKLYLKLSSQNLSFLFHIPSHTPLFPFLLQISHFPFPFLILACTSDFPQNLPKSQKIFDSESKVSTVSGTSIVLESSKIFERP